MVRARVAEKTVAAVRCRLNDCPYGFPAIPARRPYQVRACRTGTSVFTLSLMAASSDMACGRWGVSDFAETAVAQQGTKLSEVLA